MQYFLVFSFNFDLQEVYYHNTLTYSHLFSETTSRILKYEIKMSSSPVRTIGNISNELLSCIKQRP
jgi:hypothetical protein